MEFEWQRFVPPEMTKNDKPTHKMDKSGGLVSLVDELIFLFALNFPSVIRAPGLYKIKKYRFIMDPNTGTPFENGKKKHVPQGWPLLVMNGVIAPISGVVTLLITGSGPPCRNPKL